MLEGTVPTSGGTHPANAPVLLRGYNLQLDALEATVNGQPATAKTVLTVAGALGYDQQTLAFEPAPKPGQQVTLKGKVCESFGPEDKCTLDLAFSASAEDLTAPPPIDAVEFDVHDHPAMNSSVGSCTSPTDLAYFVRLKAATDSETTSYWLVDGYDAATGKTLVFSAVRPRQQDKLVLRFTDDSLQGNPLPSGICIEVTGVDLAGNKTAPVRACDPCRFRKETGDPSMDGFPPQEPAWTEADVVPGGACDPGGGGQGGSGGSGQAGSGDSGQSGAGGSGQAGSGGSGQAGSGQGGAQSGGAGPSTEGVSSEESGGCAVATGRGGASGAALGLVAALGAAMARRRRR
jgi:MYXO-CTERM domain-containing protein